VARLTIQQREERWNLSESFAVRLNRLFDTVYPPGRGPHTTAELIAALKADGIRTPARDVFRLRAGFAANPSTDTIERIAAFFGVPSAYFTDEQDVDSSSTGPLNAVGRINSMYGTAKRQVLRKSFTARLNRLFDTVYPPGRGPHTSAELVAALMAQGIRISAPYLSQLRSGTRANPSSEMIRSIAAFFRVSPAYFTDDGYFQYVDRELTLLAAMRDEEVRLVADRIVGLSPGAVDQLSVKVEELRRAEHLD
jgi:transcriptional regulator with XRE-family HTH domain